MQTLLDLYCIWQDHRDTVSLENQLQSITGIMIYQGKTFIEYSTPNETIYIQGDSVTYDF